MGNTCRWDDGQSKCGRDAGGGLYCEEHSKETAKGGKGIRVRDGGMIGENLDKQQPERESPCDDSPV